MFFIQVSAARLCQCQSLIEELYSQTTLEVVSSLQDGKIYGIEYNMKISWRRLEEKHFALFSTILPLRGLEQRLIEGDSWSHAAWVSKRYPRQWGSGSYDSANQRNRICYSRARFSRNQIMLPESRSPRCSCGATSPPAPIRSHFFLPFWKWKTGPDADIVMPHCEKDYKRILKAHGWDDW